MKPGKPSYRYLHIGISDGGGRFVSNMSWNFTEENGFHPQDHVFIVNNRDIAERINPQCPVLTVSMNQVDIINKYGDSADLIFIHGFYCSYLKRCLIKRHLDRKIVWRTWGHDIRMPVRCPGNFLKTVYRYASFALFKRRVRRFRAVGVANLVDVIKVRKAFGEHIATQVLSYGKPDSNVMQILNEQLENSPGKKDYIKIIIGHSGHETDNHLEILRRLMKYKDEKIVISLPLVYGDHDYIETVKAFAKANYGNKVEIIDEPVSIDKYIAYLATCDIAFMDMNNSAGLGNISILLSLGKKMFLHRDSDLAEAFSATETECYFSDTVPELSFTELIDPVKDKEKIGMSELSLRNACNSVEIWHTALDVLNQ